jgi:outer membrane lipoprotein carrier protein
MKNILLSLLILLLSLWAHGQNDQQAVQILDRFSAKASKAPSVSMKFRMVTTDLAERSADTLNGSIILSKDKYRLNLGENIVWYNGEINWNYLTAENEVTITRPDRKDHSFQNRPSEIFSMYKSGFKSRLVDETNSSYTIDLYPSDIAGDLVRVRLGITKPDLGLKSLEYKRKDGIDINLYFSDYDLSVKPEPGSFDFPRDKYKEAEINDMR